MNQIKIKKTILILTLLLFSYVEANVLPDINKLKSIHDIKNLEDIVETINFPEEYELPFLKGIPLDLAIDQIKNIQNGPHCFEPFCLPDPWYNIDYPRMPYLLKLKNWFIDPASFGAIFNEKQKLMLTYNKYKVFEEIENNTGKPIIEIDEGIHLLQKCSEGYYHFLIEVMPRLTLVLEFLKQNKSIKILMSEPQKKFMTEFLELLDIEESRVIYCNPANTYHVKNLYFPKPIYMGYPSQQELNRVKNNLFNKIDLSDSSSNNDLIIIIERLEARRHLNNTQNLFNEIKNNFPDLKDKIVLFDAQMHVKDQIKLFNRAKIIIGPHGAGFSNMIFSNPGAHIIEFIPGQYFGILFWHLAKAMNHFHHIITIPNAGFYSSFDVSIESVIKILESIINDKK